MEHAAKCPTIHDPDLNSESDNVPRYCQLDGCFRHRLLVFRS